VDRPRPSAAEGLLGGDFTGRLDRWLAEMRSDDAAAERAREHWLLAQAEESSTFVGVVIDLAEQSATVVVEGRGGRRHRGTIVAVASDFCALRTAAGRTVLLSYAGIAWLRPERRSNAPVGDRSAPLDATLADALGALAPDRPRILVVTIAGTDGVAGQLRTVGRDVMTLHVDGDPPAPIYVAIDGVAEVSSVDA
jgi:hypothetical protein